MNAKRKLLERMRQEVDAIPIADAHDHIMGRRESLRREVDLFDLFDRTYVQSDLVSSGMPVHAWRREEFDPEEGWRRISPYLDRVRNTSYYRSLMGALRDLYDFGPEELNDRNWRELSDKIHHANKREDWYHHVLKEKACIEVSLWDMDRERYALPIHGARLNAKSKASGVEREFFLPVLRVDPLLYGHSKAVFVESVVQRDIYRYGRQPLQEEYGVTLNGFEDYLALVDTVFKRALGEGAVAAKSAIAYQRVLRFDPVGKSEAEKIFLKPDNEITPCEVKAFEDYMMHLLVQKTIEYQLPLQFHTGLLHGFGNVLDNANPLHLTNLFLAYPQAKFVLFHGSYPYGGELSATAKTFANVFLDFNWVPMISTTAAERNLAEWLDTVPASKLEWGGDCKHVEAVYGHVLQVREVVAQVLAEKVARGYCNQEIAIDLAKKLLRDNVWEIYNLEERRGDRTLDW